MSEEYKWGPTIILTLAAFTQYNVSETHPSCVSRWWNSGLFTEEQGSALTSLVTQVIKNLPVMLGAQVWSLGQEDPLEKRMAAHASILAPVSCSPHCQKASDTTEWLTLLQGSGCDCSRAWESILLVKDIQMLLPFAVTRRVTVFMHRLLFGHTFSFIWNKCPGME